MGLSSDQARLLMLTSRQSDLEYGEVMISQRQMTLAGQSEAAAAEYNKAMSNYKITIKVDDETKATGKRDEDLKYSNLIQEGYLVADANNQIYLRKDENGEWIIPKDIKSDIFSIDENTGKAIIKGEEYNIVDASEKLSNPKILQNCIMNGRLFLVNLSEQDNNLLSLDDLASDTNLQYVLDTSDDAQAESKYEYETARISRAQNELDIELAQLETQHNAVMKEIDSVKELIDNNIDRTFKLFSNG